MSSQTNISKSYCTTQESEIFRSLIDSDDACRAITESGATCGESKSLKIIDEIQQLYEDRLRRIDEEAGGDGTQLKLKTLTAWVNDLGEQNTMLVKTVEQLEREACDRVALLEEQLQRSSRTCLEYMTKLQDYDTQMKEVTGAKKSCSKLALAQQTEEVLRTRVCNLQNDIGCLLELIHRARVDGSWSTDGLNFCEVALEDIFGSQFNQVGTTCCACEDGKTNNTVKVCLELSRPQKPYTPCNNELPYNPTPYCQSYEQSSPDTKRQEHSGRHAVSTMTEPLSPAEAMCYGLESALWKKTVSDTETQLQRTKSELRRVENNTLEQQMELVDVTKRLQDMDAQHKMILMERQHLADELALLSTQLRDKTNQVEMLTQSANSMEKSTKDMREALTAEVAEKHDQILALRREAQQLEERCRQADMQTHFRDDIIKEMRKDIKIAKSKLTMLENGSRKTVNDESVINRLGTASQPVFGHYQPYTSSQEKSHRQDRSLSTLNLYDLHYPSDKPSHLALDKPDSPPAEKPARTSLKPRGSPEKLSRSRKSLKPQLEEACSRLAYIPEMGDHLAAEQYYEIRRRSSPPNRDPGEANMSRNVQVGPSGGQKHHSSHHSTRHLPAWNRKSK